MSKKLFTRIALCLLAASAISCVKDVYTETTTTYESTDMPDLIPYTGGKYTISLGKEVTTKAKENIHNTDIPWSYRINYGDNIGEAVEFNAPKESIEVEISANHSAQKRDVTIEMNNTGGTDWFIIKSAEQDLDPDMVVIYEDTYVIFESSDIPEKVPFSGAIYTLNVSFKNVPSSKAIYDRTFIPWGYRFTCGDNILTEEFTSEGEKSFELRVKPNVSENERTITLEINNNLEGGTWKTVAEGTQESGLEEVGEDGITYFYAKSNLALDNRGNLTLAGKPEESGAFFYNGSAYAIPSDDIYAGKAYLDGEAVTMSLTELKDDHEDPCQRLSDNLRMPSYEELSMLYYMMDSDDISTVNGINGLHFRNADLFMPYDGYINIASGDLLQKNSYGAYWGNGSDYDGNKLIFANNLEYSIAPFYDLVKENLASVRCVKNIKLPSYISHTPAEITTCKETPVTIKTDPGEFQLYEVTLISDYGRTIQTGATNNKTEVTLNLPANTDKEPVKWKLFVNSMPVEGVTFEQPEYSDYADYVSHTPADKQSSESFTLNVTIDTDRASVEVMAKGSNDVEVKGTASAENPVASLLIPENTTDKDITWSIYVDGVTTGKTVVQSKPAIQNLSVEWSTGYVKVVDEEYVFASPAEYGDIFRLGSKWAIPYTGTTFPGKAYGPQEQSYTAFKDVPYNEGTDPCALVAPAGTWRIPSEAEILELTGCEYKITAKKDITFTLPDGSSLVFAPHGSVTASSGKLMLPDGLCAFWSSTPNPDKPTTNTQYGFFSISSASSEPKTASILNTNGLQIRCVRNK